MTLLKPNDILIIGPNAASQTTLFFDDFRAHNVNRAYKKSHSIGGKGQNCALACHKFGFTKKVTLLQTVGGETGQYVGNVLRQKDIHHVNILDASTGFMTELIEPTSLITEAECADFESNARQLITNGGDIMKMIAICGSCPNGMTSRTLATIASLKPPSTLLYVDAVKDIELILETRKVDIIKINTEEFSQIVNQLKLGRIVVSDRRTDELNVREFPQLAHELMDHYGISMVAVTNGPKRAFMFQRGSPVYHTFKIPDLVAVLQRMYFTNLNLFIEKHVENCLPPTITLEHRQKMLEWESENEVCLERMRKLQRDTRMSSDGHPGRPGGDMVPHPSSQLGSALSPHAKGNGLNGSARNDSARQLDDMTSKPPIQLLLNPLGAGDTTNGVFICEYLQSRDPLRAFAMGLAAATASCLVTDFTGYYDVNIMYKVFDGIQVEKHSLHQ
ncbi:hypothetical protein H4R33_006539 [Dimargaris cristalligena]|uniref:Ribokinase-like protein n=1 Tax=Dimargaris cristalligena TaxID=215637 RepID=A0A4P9ZV96_9FUNG|nr:hypothetical protein H4R33_006539 [Dimargaris cristalligena]RKP37198.1 Ribokinase-like protein [Dimargaris cristalligena]|eukprot:RKP37198.1 Ribokinase-like protein [Dimargaris cristalligena]